MSLHFYLEFGEPRQRETSGIFIREAGRTLEITREQWDILHPDREPVMAVKSSETAEVFHANITGNLYEMAKEAGVADCLWDPAENNYSKASQLIGPLAAAINAMLADPERFEKFNPSNGWGDYGALLSFLQDLFEACQKFPQATIRASA